MHIRIKLLSKPAKAASFAKEMIMNIDNLSKSELMELSERISNRLRSLDEALSNEATYEKLIFEARNAWLGGDHSSDNLWANWKFEQAESVENPNCGTFEYWLSISPEGSKDSQIENMVNWAENVLWAANLKPSYSVVSGYVRSDGRYVRGHLREI